MSLLESYWYEERPIILHDLFRYNTSVAFQHTFMFSSDVAASMSDGKHVVVHAHTNNYSWTNCNNSSPASHRFKWKLESSHRIALFSDGEQGLETWSDSSMPLLALASQYQASNDYHADYKRRIVSWIYYLFLPNMIYNLSKILSISLAFNKGPKGQLSGQLKKIYSSKWGLIFSTWTFFFLINYLWLIIISQVLPFSL